MVHGDDAIRAGAVGWQWSCLQKAPSTLHPLHGATWPKDAEIWFYWEQIEQRKSWRSPCVNTMCLSVCKVKHVYTHVLVSSWCFCDAAVKLWSSFSKLFGLWNCPTSHWESLLITVNQDRTNKSTGRELEKNKRRRGGGQKEGFYHTHLSLDATSWQVSVYVSEESYFLV